VVAEVPNNLAAAIGRLTLAAAELDNADGGSWDLLAHRTHLRHPADLETLDGPADRLLRVRDRLLEILAAQLDNQPLTPTA